MNFFKLFINLFSTITVGISMVCAAIFLLVPEYEVSRYILLQVLLASFSTALLTAVGIYFFARLDSKLKAVIACAVHYVLLCAVMIGFGIWFDWMNFNLEGIVMMTTSVAAVYLITFLLNYILIKKEADDINEALKERHGQK